MTTAKDLNYQEKFGLRMRQQREASKEASGVPIRDLLYHMAMSGERRRLILAWLNSDPQNNQILVNQNYCRQVRYDTDLQRLLQEGTVKLIRIRQAGKRFSKFWKFSGKANTYLVSALYQR